MRDQQSRTSAWEEANATWRERVKVLVMLLLLLIMMMRMAAMAIVF